jgi:hypothetical protein
MSTETLPSDLFDSEKLAEIARLTRIFRHGDFLNEKKAENLATSLYIWSWGSEIAKNINPELVSRLNQTLRADDSSRFRYFNHPDASEAIERLSEDDTWETHREQFRRLDSGGGESEASRQVAFLDLVENQPEVYAWLGGQPQEAANFLNFFANLDDYSQFVVSPRREEIQAKLEPREVGMLASMFGTQSLEEAPDLLLEYYQIPREDRENWSTRLRLLAKALYQRGLLGVDDQILNQQILAAYKSNLSRRIASELATAGKIRDELTNELEFVQETLKQGYAGRVQLINGLRLDLSHRQMAQMRQKLGAPVSEWKHQHDYERRLKRLDLDWREDTHHPSRRLRVSLGYEIEFEPALGIDVGLFNLAEYLGFTAGAGSGLDDVMETSPGPWWDYRTARETFLLWTRSGLVDAYASWGQSFHLNLGLKAGEGGNLLMRGLQLTALAYMPEFGDNFRLDDFAVASSHTLRLSHNRQRTEEDYYTECKEFELLTPGEMLRFLRTSHLLGSALKAYQEVYFAKYPWKRITDFGQNYQYPIYVDQHPVRSEAEIDVAIHSNLADEYTLRLARVWVEYARLMEGGLRQRRLERFLLPSVPNSTARRVVSEMRKVYPTYWSHYEVKSSQVEVEPFTYGENQFANIVHLARFASARAANQAEGVIKQMEAEFSAELTAVLARYTKADARKLIAKYPLSYSNKDLPSAEVRDYLEYLAYRNNK